MRVNNGFFQVSAQVVPTGQHIAVRQYKARQKSENLLATFAKRLEACSYMGIPQSYLKISEGPWSVLAWKIAWE